MTTIQVAPGIRIGMPTGVQASLDAGHITRTEARLLHEIAVWCWTADNLELIRSGAIFRLTRA